MMKRVLKNVGIFSILVLVLSFLGCDNEENIKLPDVVAGFTYTVNQATGTVVFTNISEEATKYEWDFGDGETSTLVNPVKTYESGNYSVTLTASNEAGASASFEDEVSIVLPEVLALPITFDNPDIDYTPTAFGGTSFEILANPDVSGSNDKESNVGAITNSGAEFEGIFFDLEIPVDLVEQQSISMNFWSEAPIDVQMKLEEGTGDDSETTASHGGTGWEEIVFDFTSSDSFSRITLFVDGPGTTAGTFYIDDIAQVGSDPGPGDCEAETGQSLNAADFNLTFQTDPGSAIVGDGTVYSFIDNPDTDNEVNPSCKVGQIDRDASLPFANTQIEFDDKFDFNMSGGFSLKVWAPAVGTNVLVKLEDKTNGAIATEVGTATTTANAWEELTFDFPASESGKYDKIVLFFDINTDSGATYYIDDFALFPRDGDGPSLEVCEGGELINDFETADDSIFSNFGGGVGTIIDNPDTSVNTSAKVGQYVKGAGEVFAGITIEVDPDIDFNAGVFSIDVSSQAVRQLLFKLEGLGIEQIIPTSGTGWETITYDFSAVAGNVGDVTAITLIMDNGTAGDGSADWTIQFDNIRLCSNESGGGGPSLEVCPGGELVNDFESADDSIFSNFGGGVGTIIDNPDTSVNTSAKVGQYVKGTGEVFAGITIEVDPDIDFNAGVFSIDVSSQAVRQLLFKLEGLGIEQIVPTSGMGWETITYDFSSVGGNVGAVTAITLIMDNGTAGDGSGDWTIQFDNIRLCSNESGGGGTSGCSGDFVAATTLPLDFEGCETFLPELNFGAGLTSGITANPSKSGINTSDFVLEVDKPTGSDFFAGIQNVFPTNFDLTTTNTFKIKIYSTKANAVFRFELLANPNDGSIGNPGPVFATVANANEWTEVEFTFTGLPAGPTAYSQLVIKPDNDQVDSPITNGGTYYLDDLRLE